MKEHLDKFLLAAFVVYFSLLGWVALFHIDTSSPFEQAFLNAMLDNQKLVIGALLGLITGRALAANTSTVTTEVTKTLPPPPEAPKSDG